MGSMFSKLQSVLFQQDSNILLFSLLLGTLIGIIIFIFGPSSSYLKYVIKRFIGTQLRKRVIDSKMKGSDTDMFASYYRNSLCHLQKVNNELLSRILQNNHSCAFFVDRSISFVSSSSSSSRYGEYTSIDNFRKQVPLTTYDDYRDYVDRMVQNGEKNLLTAGKIIYFVTTSGTTGKSKLLPVAETMMATYDRLLRIGSCTIWRSLPSFYPSPEQRSFQLCIGKKSEMFPRSKDGTAIGALALTTAACRPGLIFKTIISAYNVITIDLIEEITDFETSTFVQLVFALSVPDLFSYSVTFGSGFIHTVKIIEKYFEEMSQCISSADFDHSSLVQNNIHDSKLRMTLNRALNNITLEYGGLPYGLKRAEHIRKECLKKDVPGILHRLWPTLVFASTGIGSSFALYKDEIQYYCGKKLPLINMIMYAASEGLFGSLASIHTDEYLLSPTSAFFEFIKEEDIHEAQPKTLLISEIEPGNRYELVVTTEAGLVRYRMGDIINCTRFLSRANDLVPLPSEPAEIPRIPLISVAYRIGTILNITGEKTSEEHLMYALQQTIDDWKAQGIPVQLRDFTSFSKLDAFPPQYVIFMEMIDEEEHKLDKQYSQILKKNADLDIERNLCKANHSYHRTRNGGKLGPLISVLVRSGTFSTFRQNILMTSKASPLQVKPHRLLKNEDHIRFFYNNELKISFF